MYEWPEQKKGSENPRARFTADQVQGIRERAACPGVTIRQLAEETGAGRSTIGRILKGERYQE